MAKIGVNSNKPKLSADRVRVSIVVFSYVLIALLGGFGGAWLVNHHNDGTMTGNLSNQKRVVTSQSQLVSQIARTVGPSVVSVNVNITANSSATSQDPYSQLFGFAQPAQQVQAAGTGIIISSSGIVMTNRHVVPAGTTSVSVTLNDGTELKNVSVISRTSDSDNLDVAFLKIGDTQGHKLQAAQIGDSSQVQVGDNVVAIGNALGQFQNTVTSGIISGYGRSVQAGGSSGNIATAENLDNLIQTDAAINEGNSGGPLTNLNGQVIGINTATAGNAQNIGFAIPINDVKGLITQIITSGKVSRPYLGVRYVPLSADIASQFGLKTQNGAFVAPSSDPATPSVISGGPADKAGIKEKDIIIAVNGTKIDSTHSLTSLLSSHQPGDSIKLTILRGDKTLHLAATLGKLPDTAAASTNQ